MINIEAFSPQFTDGVCSSACAIFANLLINQGNVRTAAVGGRPNTKPMAVIGGVQGSQALEYRDLRVFINATLDYLHDSGTVTALDKVASSAILTPIIAPPPLNYFPGDASLSVNLLDSIAAKDTTQTPLQFTRSPNAECRFFYMPRDLLSVEYTWTRLAKGFRNNGKGLCIGGAAGFSPTNGTVGGSTGTASGSTSGPIRTLSPILPFNGGLSAKSKQDNKFAMIVAASTVCSVMLMTSL